MNPRRTALLVIDMQRGLLQSESPLEIPLGNAIIPRVNQLARACRARAIFVVFTRMSHDYIGGGPYRRLWPSHFKPDGTPYLKRGSPMFEIDPRVERRPQDVIVDKDRYSAFFGTNLDTVLKDRRVETLFITGVASNVCCESTARDAFFRDYTVYLISDATAALTQEQHRAALENIRLCFGWVISTQQAYELMGASPIRAVLRRRNPRAKASHRREG